MVATKSTSHSNCANKKMHRTMQKRRWAKHAGLASRCPLRILVAEDHPVNRRIIQTALDKMGYTSSTRIVEDGLQVLQNYKHGEFDLILLDIHMPNMTGDVACKTLLERFPDLPPIMALTSAVSSNETSQWLEAGFEKVMAKPIDITVLASVLESTGARKQKKCKQVTIPQKKCKQATITREGGASRRCTVSRKITEVAR